ncbi:hypothetical protein HBB16_08670 [Pseudonocardia sp. MCCB 268]|nr:hypothetical protein [Pseudonocardia cytotoxica]
MQLAGQDSVTRRAPISASVWFSGSEAAAPSVPLTELRDGRQTRPRSPAGPRQDGHRSRRRSASQSRPASPRPGPPRSPGAGRSVWRLADADAELAGRRSRSEAGGRPGLHGVACAFIPVPGPDVRAQSWTQFVTSPADPRAT